MCIRISAPLNDAQSITINTLRSGRLHMRKRASDSLSFKVLAPGSIFPAAAPMQSSTNQYRRLQKCNDDVINSLVPAVDITRPPCAQQPTVCCSPIYLSDLEQLGVIGGLGAEEMPTGRIAKCSKLKYVLALSARRDCGS
jgi:hypothetical protein